LADAVAGFKLDAHGSAGHAHQRPALGASGHPA
ncbi:methyl-accepting chemotaxis protein, partial [Paracidovorax cattleyae]